MESVKVKILTGSKTAGTVSMHDMRFRKILFGRVRKCYYRDFPFSEPTGLQKTQIGQELQIWKYPMISPT